MRWPRFTSRKIPGTHFCYTLCQPQGLKGIGLLKNPMTSSAIDPATFQPIAHFLNQLGSRNKQHWSKRCHSYEVIQSSKWVPWEVAKIADRLWPDIARVSDYKQSGYYLEAFRQVMKRPDTIIRLRQSNAILSVWGHPPVRQEVNWTSRYRRAFGREICRRLPEKFPRYVDDNIVCIFCLLRIRPCGIFPLRINYETMNLIRNG
jgi:hypothetical protein